MFPGYVPAVLTLLFLVFVLLIVVSLLGAARRHRRAVEAQEEAMRRAAAGEGGPFDGASQSGMFPFGGLLESLMKGVGARSFRYDPETGEWVEMTEVLPPPEEMQESGETGPASRNPRRHARVQPRSRYALSAANGVLKPLSFFFGGSPR